MAQCLLIDGNNIVFRAFYAFGNQRLKTKSGLQTGAIYGFVRMLTKVLKEKKPELVAVAFDTSRNTFRKRKYPEYKAQRKPVPEELLMQLPLARKAVEALGIKMMTHEDYEADDLIGSTAKALETNYDVEVITGDRDLLQLIDDKITVTLCHKGVSEMKAMTPESFNQEYGFEPKGIIELKALWGDTSDNIPGVPSIGEKKGMALVQQFGSIENLYSNIDKVENEKMRQKLLDGKESAELSHYLATIVTDVKTFESNSELIWNENNLNSEAFLLFLQQYEFYSLYKEFSGNTEVKPLENAVVHISATTRKESGEETAVSLELANKLPGERILIHNLDELQKFWNEQITDKVCLDCETNGLNPFKDKIIGVSFASGIEKAAYVPIRHSYLGLTPADQLEPQQLFDFLNKNLPNKLIIGHNLKFDLEFLRNEGIEITCETKDNTDFLSSNCIFDTLIAAYVIDPTRSNALKSLGQSLLNFEVTEYNKVANAGEFAGVDLEIAKDYGCQDVLLTMHLYGLLKKELEERKLTKLFEEIEMPLLKILMNMETVGIGLNSDYLHKMSDEVEGRIAQLEESIYDYAGHTFNINSTKQLGEVLFNELKLIPPKKTKTGFSTDSDVLKMLSYAHPICNELLEYREMAKIKSTYADSLLSLVDKDTGLIHASFNQAVTATGRLSSSNPNLQNIPIKTEWGKKIRRAFIPPRQGDVFLSIDYSQIELRMLAHFSQDPALVEAYKNGTDIHAISASRIFRKPVEEITSAERSVGKTVNFGIIYGISAHGLSQDLGVPRAQSQNYIDSFFESFPKVNEFFDGVVNSAKETGEVVTLLGRVRKIEDINSTKFQPRSAAERMAKNTRLQGSAADLVKKAMIDTCDFIKKKGFKAKLVVQIHDELIFSMPESELPVLAPELKHIMENCVTLNIPLVCDMASGPNLTDLEDM